VATAWCGDDHAVTEPGAIDEIVRMAQQAGGEVIVAGPAFGSGRYGVACARVAAAAARAGLRAVAAMHPDNPGLEEGAPVVVASGSTARDARSSCERLAAALRKLLAGAALGPDDGLLTRPRRATVRAPAPAAERAVDLLLARLAGDDRATEIPPPAAAAVDAAAPVDPSTAVIALLTEGGLVPAGNPDRLESARASRWLRYRIAGSSALEPGRWECIHGGFSVTWANADPNRIVPLDAAVELAAEGRIGRLHAEYLVTVGNGTSVAAARRFGVEWAAELRKAGVQAAILTAT